MDAERCARIDIALSKWLENSWEASDRTVPSELQQHADECDRCHHRLLAALRLLGTGHETPAGLAESVMARIGHERRPGAPRRVPLLAAAALLVVALGLGLFVGTTRADSVTVELTLHAPQASSVAVVGGWNDWDATRDPMRDPDGDGIWQIELRLKGGTEYLYQFVIDDEIRIADPLALINVDDGFGGVNSVVNL